MTLDNSKNRLNYTEGVQPGTDAQRRKDSGEPLETGYQSLVDEFIKFADRFRPTSTRTPADTATGGRDPDFLNLDSSDLYASLLGGTDRRKTPDVVAARRTERKALHDWLFTDDHSEGDAPQGLKRVDLTGRTPDGRDIHVAGEGDALRVDVGGDSLTKDKSKRKTTFESDRFIAVDENGVKSFTDKSTGFTTRWDSANNRGEVVDANGNVAFTFDSRDALRAQVTHRLTDRRNVTQLAGEQDLDGAVRTELEARKTTDPSTHREHIFVDRNGDYAVITRDELVYRTDRANNRVLVEQDGHLLSVHDGRVFVAERDQSGKIIEGKEITDFAEHFGQDAERFERGCRRVRGRCHLDLDETRVDTENGTLRTRSDTGDVDVTSGRGRSTVVNPGVASVTVDDQGVITNNSGATSSVFSTFDLNRRLLTGDSNGTQTFQFNPNSITVPDSNNGQVVINNDGKSYWLDHTNANLLDFGPNSPIPWFNNLTDSWVDYDDGFEYSEDKSFFEQAWTGPTPEQVVNDTYTEVSEVPAEAARLNLAGLSAEEANLAGNISMLEYFLGQATSQRDYDAINKLTNAINEARAGLERLRYARADRLDDERDESIADNQKLRRRDGSDRDSETDLV